MYGDPLA